MLGAKCAFVGLLLAMECNICCIELFVLIDLRTLAVVFEQCNIFEILACCFNCSRMQKSN